MRLQKLMLVAAVSTFVACSGDIVITDFGTKTDTDADTDSDADSDADTDADTDSDADTDTGPDTGTTGTGG